jgi:hypothetical protein
MTRGCVSWLARVRTPRHHCVIPGDSRLYTAPVSAPTTSLYRCIPVWTRPLPRDPFRREGRPASALATGTLVPLI